jgi:pyruvate dehydrogenase E1 component alpha subunit
MVEAAAERYLETAPQEPRSMFDHLYASLPEPLRAQRESLPASVAEAGDADHG